MPSFAIPPALLRRAALGPAWVAWLEALPRTLADVVGEWGLTQDGPPTHGQCSVVVPVRTRDGRLAALKVAFPDDESEHEHLALQHWHGNGAVLLLRADPRRRTMLLERLHAEDLGRLEDVEACEVVAGLYGRLHVPALPQLRPLTSYVERWTAGLEALPRDAPVPRRLVEQAVSLARDFLVDPASTGSTIHADLHYENVLAGDREPWLAIDPTPVSGDPHYEVAPLLWNRWEELLSSGEIRDRLRRRFHAVVDTAGLEEERSRDWVVVRALHNVAWSVEEAHTQGRGHCEADRDWTTRMVTVAKAVQD